ncbi:peroxisomal membrane protein PEX31 [Coccidioides immitis RMSCC 3703]|uniref:Peroxisomal membrane protein PEX31 n=1 Tax=Coccidioides immitis RMSCC 3703 TaxID=454286 RepID=A0A0J8QVL5_COCIT|nr:peroxisomal membrane protein PEX31 [Coccidioides immitis RMSCC 3703]
MAALETPWIASMSPSSYAQNDGPAGTSLAGDPIPPTVAAFSPTNISGSSLTSKQRSTIIVHRKSPLLVATPPAVTRALAYSHPFLLPLNRLVGLLSWTSGDPWESFLLVAAFWATTLYGDTILLWAGPILVVIGLILGLYSRRYSPLSSTGLTGEKHGHRRGDSEATPQHHKTLDEIVESLREFTMRCNILLDPLIEFTDFLSTQRTATSATTRPALTALLTRILLVTPVWILLTLPPFYLITTRRIIISVGTVILTWHSKPARICRVILWRSLTVRLICSIITGLPFSSQPSNNTTNDFKISPILSLLSFRPFRSKSTQQVPEVSTTRRRAESPGVRFTFILYENQRRWLGIGWTTSLFAYERAPWTDEHLNSAPSKDEFELPEVQGGNSRWRWVSGSEWRIDGVDPNSKRSGKTGKGGDTDDGGWIYYDNKWNDGRRGQDSWNRYTRRRRWCRDAELVEVTPSREATPPPSPPAERVRDSSPCTTTGRAQDEENNKPGIENKNGVKQRKRRWFGSTSDISKPPSSSPPVPVGAASSSLPNNFDNALSTSIDENTNNSRRTVKAPSVASTRSAPQAGSPGTRGGRSSFGGRRASKTASIATDTDRESLTLSLREKEIQEAENMVDQWDTRPGGAAERAERSWGLGDEAHMGLS